MSHFTGPKILDEVETFEERCSASANVKTDARISFSSTNYHLPAANWLCGDDDAPDNDEGDDEIMYHYTGRIYTINIPVESKSSIDSELEPAFPT